MSINKEKSVIPFGPYCYHGVGRRHPCLFWSIKPDLPKQMNGYCSYLNKSDVDLEGGLLWDQVKECGINDE